VASIVTLPGDTALPLASLPSQAKSTSPVALPRFSVRSTAPALSLIVTLVSVVPLGTVILPNTAPFASCIAVRLGVSAYLPTRLVAEPSWLLPSVDRIEASLVFMSLIPCSDENCAICATNASFSTGFSGSWFFSCVVSSRMKSLWSSVLFCAALVAAAAAFALSVERMPSELQSKLLAVGSTVLISYLTTFRITGPA
jgi:hypothetical protein